MRKFQRALVAFCVIAVVAGCAGAQSKIDDEVRNACRVGVVMRGGTPAEGEPDVVLFGGISNEKLPSYRVAGGSIDGRSVHCLVRWDTDQGAARAAMVRWDSTNFSVDL